MPAASTRHRPDEELLVAARRGCPDAITALYERYHRLTVSVAARVLSPSDRSLAEDAAQSAFIDVVAALRNGGGPSTSLRPYLVTAVRRHAWRSHREARGPSDAGGGGEGGEVVDRLVDLRERRSDGHDLLRRALDRVPDRMRLVLWATEVEGHSAEEIAELLDVTPNAVYVLRYRARRRLVTAYLEEYLGIAGEECRRAVDELEVAIQALDPEGTSTPTSHLASCASCRDMVRGIDVAVA